MTSNVLGIAVVGIRVPLTGYQAGVMGERSREATFDAAVRASFAATEPTGSAKPPARLPHYLRVVDPEVSE